ncbi:MAG: helix-turn-helix domain-containing protein [Kiritimatiellia bacterium]
MMRSASWDTALYLGAPKLASGVSLAGFGFGAAPSMALWWERPIAGVVFVLCRSGALTCAVSDHAPVACRAGELFVAFPDRRLTVAPASAQARFIHLELQGPQAVPAVLGLGYRHAFHAQGADTARLHALAEAVASGSLPGDGAQILPQLEQVLCDLWRDCRERSDAPEFLSLLRAIHCLPTNALTTEKVAAALNISRTGLNQLFMKGCGLRPGAYLAGLKAEIARALLADGQLTIAQIAARTGFSSASALACFFRRQVGVAPSDYRRNRERRQSPEGGKKAE